MSAPDVTVVVPVYNTMPYLATCVKSLVTQTIGLERMEIIAVDDGSTDRGGRLLDRVARRFPNTVTVIHQANSGGPAGPCNRALDVASGRYVIFVGADDYLGAEALDRLVHGADRYGSDVVLGRMVGVNGRYVDQAVFARDRVDVSLSDSALPFSLANTKLFRRELIERYKLRYPEDMPLGSDQPFTLEACYRADRVSVLTDYDYYYVVWRLDSRNLTYSSRHAERLHCAQRLMEFAADLIPAGEERDAVLLRHFALEVAKLLEDDFLRLDRGVQQRIHAGVRTLADRYLTDAIRERLSAETRLRLTVARGGSLDDLLGVIRHDAVRGVPRTVLDGGRRFAAYPGFRDGRRPRPDGWFDVTDSSDWIAKLDATAALWTQSDTGGRALTVTAWSPQPDLLSLCGEPISLTAEEISGLTTAVPDIDRAGTFIRASFGVDELVARSAPLGRRRAVQARVTVRGRVGVAPVRGPGLTLPLPIICSLGRRLYVVALRRDESGRLMITVAPLTPRRAVAHLIRRATRGRVTA